MNLTLSEVLENYTLLAALQIFSKGKNRMLRRYSDSLAVATVDLDVFQPGWYLVESANGDEFLEFTTASDGLFLAKDGRAFPMERAHYIVGIVQLFMSNDEDQPKPVAELDYTVGQKEKGGESGYDPDQEE